MKYKAVIFDLDGTILDTLEDLADAVNFALRQSGLPERTIDEVRAFVGNGIRKLIDRAVPEGMPVEKTDKVFADFRDYYAVHCADKTKPYPGIMELLSELKAKGVKLAVVSNKADDAVKVLCEQYYKGIFDIAVGEREGIRKKPAPDSVLEVLKTLGLAKHETVYVGDSDVDVETSGNAGLEHIAVTWGFRDFSFLQEHGARVFVSKPEDILRQIV